MAHNPEPAGAALLLFAEIQRERCSEAHVNPDHISETTDTNRQQQAASLQNNEAHLQDLATRAKKEEFFKEIVPLLGPLKSYLGRLLRAAYLEQEIRTPIYTSDAILNSAILKAYNNFERKPVELPLEQWLYQLANETLTNYLKRRQSRDAQRRSLETLDQAERRTLEEVEHITADAEGEVLLDEDLDDAELYEKEFATPAVSDDNPEKLLERKDEVQQIIRALARIPEQERIVFELVAIEGFSSEAAGRMLSISTSEVERIKNKVRQAVLRQLQSAASKKAS
jgi:RNA polymerase sigma factor (sigma-70 family)